jgi:hypothetical protein
VRASSSRCRRCSPTPPASSSYEKLEEERIVGPVDFINSDDKEAHAM